MNMQGKKDILIFSGAGISSSAGIKTFEELPHLRDIYSLDFYHENYEVFWKTLTELKKSLCDIEPTRAHKAIAGEKLEVITMNVDGLHQKAGSENVLEVHGNLHQVRCLCCKQCFDFDIINKSLFCPNDGSKLRPNVALYGDMVPEYKEAIQKLKKYARKDIIIVGTSFKTGFAGSFYDSAKLYMCRTHIINARADEELPELIQEIQIGRELEW